MQTILFEDHSWRRLRPVAWTVPTYEIRCGLFNLRERVELLAPGLPGLVLSRRLLGPLHTAPGWQAGAPQPGKRALWLSGRLSPRADLVQQLHILRDNDWLLEDELGLLAASLPAAASEELYQSWCQWQSGGWTEAKLTKPASLARLRAPDLDDIAGRLDLGWIWDIVPATAAAIEADLILVAAERVHSRYSFGVIAQGDAVWSRPGSLRRVGEVEGIHQDGSGGLYLGSGGQDVAPGTHCNTSAGPIVLDSGVRIMPHVYLEGPLYLGRGTVVKAGARIYGESSFGLGNRLAGEIGESTFGDFANKQHDGFIGHAILGSWVNLGALTTCSDLKNNYGPVRVDLGEGAVDTGQRFVGAMIGDHVRTAIGTLLNTGTVIDCASNLFGGAMPSKFVPGFSWGGQPGSEKYDIERAQATNEVVCGRRGCAWTKDHTALLAFLHGVASTS